MITFDTDDALTGAKPEGLDPHLWEIARDVAEEHLHEELCTFYLPESAEDLADGGPIAEPVCCGGSLAARLADGPFVAVRRETPDGGAVWVAPVTSCGYRADVLLIPEADWLPDDIRRALDAARTREGDDDA